MTKIAESENENLEPKTPTKTLLIEELTQSPKTPRPSASSSSSALNICDKCINKLMLAGVRCEDCSINLCTDCALGHIQEYSGGHILTLVKIDDNVNTSPLNAASYSSSSESTSSSSSGQIFAELSKEFYGRIDKDIGEIEAFYAQQIALQRDLIRSELRTIINLAGCHYSEKKQQTDQSSDDDSSNNNNDQDELNQRNQIKAVFNSIRFEANCAQIVRSIKDNFGTLHINNDNNNTVDSSTAYPSTNNKWTNDNVNPFATPLTISCDNNSLTSGTNSSSAQSWSSASSGSVNSRYYFF
jgi:hypothetical protein